MIIAVSYNARYAKLREVKNAHFPDFGRSRPGWFIFGLGSTVLRILQFLSYFIDFFVSRLQFVPVSIYVLALLHFMLLMLRFMIYSLRLWLFICFCVDTTLRVSSRTFLTFLWMFLHGLLVL